MVRTSAVCAVLFGVAACAGGGAAPADDVTVLTFWSSLRGTESVIDRFNETHDDVHVEFTDTPTGAAGTNSMLYNSVRAGNAPDVATMETNIAAQFALDGVLLDITEDITPAVREAMLPQAFDLTTFDGRTYGLALDIEPMMMYYRADLFEKYGIEVPTTWADYRAAAEQLAAQDPDVHIGSFFTNGAAHMASYVWQTGDPWFSADDDGWEVGMTGAGSQRVAEYWQGMVDDDLVKVLSDGGQEWSAAVANDKIATFLVGAWGGGALMGSMPGSAGAWRVAPLPYWEDQGPSTGTQGGSAFGIPVGSEHPDEALELIEWMITDEAAMRARIATGTSSMYPAVTDLVKIGRETLDASYFGGQDIYGVFEEAAATVPTDWMWGPRTALTDAALIEQLAKVRRGTTVLDALSTAQEETYRDMAALGLQVRTREDDA